MNAVRQRELAAAIAAELGAERGAPMHSDVGQPATGANGYPAAVGFNGGSVRHNGQTPQQTTSQPVVSRPSIPDLPGDPDTSLVWSPDGRGHQNDVSVGNGELVRNYLALAAVFLTAVFLVFRILT